VLHPIRDPPVWRAVPSRGNVTRLPSTGAARVLSILRRTTEVIHRSAVRANIEP
jgi:hypothetical protein